MRIEFSKSFEDTQEKMMKITKREVIRTVTNPLRKQSVPFGESKTMLYIQKESGPANSYILVMGQRRDNTLHVDDRVFRILPDLIEQSGTNEPIILLQQLALNFGVTFKIGEHMGKFFFREFVPLPESQGSTPLIEFRTKKGFKPFVKVEPRPNGKFNLELEPIEEFDSPIGLGSMMARFSKGFVECAMVFSIEPYSYLSWINGQRKLQVIEKYYDVFISYKRSTGKDFACALKSCLVDEGYRAFLDLEDIPKEFENTEKWFEIRNAAISNTRRFLLIITIKVDSSKEVARELQLARQIHNMKFMYLRHKDLPPTMSISYDSQKIDWQKEIKRYSRMKRT